jgi:hypothetical protein
MDAPSMAPIANSAIHLLFRKRSTIETIENFPILRLMSSPSTLAVRENRNQLAPADLS